MVPAFRAALQVHLVETSPSLRAAQQQRLGMAVAGWHDDPATLPEGPAIILANEFFDALPIRQFIRRDGAWLERHVAAGRFLDLPAAASPPLPAEAPEGAIGEWAEAGRPPRPASPPAAATRAAPCSRSTTARPRPASATACRA
ncbi:SAM-dependent methyltransferase [Dankookia sp. P2]|uniref:SAM-dependent methyltransferase n=1 Tax=Dankookia sp. P2 TaxID=3423955 RepID=UPI003D6648D8